ncbi:MAG: sugar ABC transporter permease [Caldilineaceae bacterium]|uniref:Sugar ABC transporter permease n=1 Tax=Caldilineaceae bacterium SB0675_bin_29 TaxID=2605266 RepID=A0A6B1FYT5_9CHLR|nr:sugar ABC transporter permease [Caldilineaceae bacterium]MYH61217.1 sugar ABC transporter permease [Caldilineaceae bacterium SB0675_bin_29]
MTSIADGSGASGRAETMGAWFVVKKTLRKPQFWFGFTMIVPLLIWYWIFSFWPIIQAFRMSTVAYKLLDPANSPFVGIGNFLKISQHPLFLVSVKNTILWAVYSFIFHLPLAMLIAVFLSKVRRGRNVYQALIFVPVVVSLVAVSLLFKMLMDPEVGQLNKLLSGVGLPELQWLSSSSSALPTAVIIATWKGLGFYVVILTAGMMNIPSELYDAALVDGTNPWQQFWRITMPLMGHTILLITVLLAIGSLQEFTLPTVLFGSEGGPGNSTYLYNMLIYQEAFLDIRFGTATAASLLQFAFILAISVLQIKLIRPSWSY